MKERPILFSGSMVRALLDGTKTQTRRAVKLTDAGRVKAVGSNCNWHVDDPDAVKACPHGKPGDRLWVRETFRIFGGDEYAYQKRIEDVRYCASSEAIDHVSRHWKPSIFMPRWASRLTLEITAVRIERLTEIDGHEAWAEGCPYHAAADPSRESIINWFREVWESSYGAGSWAANPWVWVIEFRRVSL